LAGRVGQKFKFPPSLYFHPAPTIYNYPGPGDSFASYFFGNPPFPDESGKKITPNQPGVNNPPVFDLPMEFGWTIGELPMRVFGEYARNFSGEDRARAAGHPDKTDQVNAYQVGLGIGKLRE